jgi:hypothetical protein
MAAGVLLRVAYDGRPFSGFARQDNARTVAGELLGAVRALDPNASELRGTSRTDAGVHARAQLVAFDARLDIPPRGNLLVVTLPGLDAFRSEEFGALDAWVRRGNTLLINAALLDQPGWAAGNESSAVVELESLTAIEFETREGREARLDNKPLSERVREADERDAKKDEDDEEFGQPDTDERRYEVPEKIVLHATGPHALLDGVRTLALETDFEPGEWSLRMPYDNFVLTLARDAKGEGALFEKNGIAAQGRDLLGKVEIDAGCEALLSRLLREVIKDLRFWIGGRAGERRSF